MGGPLIRSIGLVRAKARIGLRNLAINGDNTSRHVMQACDPGDETLLKLLRIKP